MPRLCRRVSFAPCRLIWTGSLTPCLLLDFCLRSHTGAPIARYTAIAEPGQRYATGLTRFAVLTGVRLCCAVLAPLYFPGFLCPGPVHAPSPVCGCLLASLACLRLSCPALRGCSPMTGLQAETGSVCLVVLSYRAELVVVLRVRCAAH